MAAFCSVMIWLVVWNIFYFPIYWESSSQLTHIFQRGSNHQPDMYIQMHVEFMKYYEIMYKSQSDRQEGATLSQATPSGVVTVVKLSSTSNQVRINRTDGGSVWELF